MAKLFLVTLGFVAIALLFLCVKIVFQKGGRFGSEHIGQSRAMRSRGIHCAQSTDKMEYGTRRNVHDMEK